MKAKLFRRFIPCLTLLALPLLWTGSGCASTPKVDWENRVGLYTYDQAVAEMGPPDKSAQLSDGKTVAEWWSSRPSRMSIGLGTGYGHHVGSSTIGTGVGVSAPVGPTPDRILRLTFDDKGTLVNWQKAH